MQSLRRSDSQLRHRADPAFQPSLPCGLEHLKGFTQPPNALKTIRGKSLDPIKQFFDLVKDSDCQSRCDWPSSAAEQCAKRSANRACICIPQCALDTCLSEGIAGQIAQLFKKPVYIHCAR